MKNTDEMGGNGSKKGGKKRKPEWPKVIRIGQTRATIYKTPKEDFVSFTVAWYEGPVRKRKVFADLAAAELHAHSQVNNLSEGETRAAKLTGEECLEFIRSREFVKEFGLSLVSAAAEYRD